MTDESATTSGYRIENVYASELLMRAVLPSGDLPPEGDSFSYGWDWRYVPDQPDLFEILIKLSVQPTLARRQQLSAAVVGRFRILGEGRVSDVPTFAFQNGPFILFPYLREYLTDLSRKGPGAPYFLPPLNTVILMRRMKPELATGARQGTPGAALPSVDSPAIALTSAENEPPTTKRSTGRKRARKAKSSSH